MLQIDYEIPSPTGYMGKKKIKGPFTYKISYKLLTMKISII